MREDENIVASPLVNNRFYALDGLRLFAALLVAGFHYCFVAGRDGFSTAYIYPEVTKYMYLGVSLFFMLSGFVITYSGNKKSVKAFLILRGVRLYPAFWFCMLITFVGASILFGDPRLSTTWRDAILNTTMLPSYFGAHMVDGVYWTLLVEIKFYILFSLFMGLKKWVKLEWSLFAWMLIYSINQFVFKVPLAHLIAYPESPLFMIGILLYLLALEGIDIFRMVALVVALVFTFQHEQNRALANALNFGMVFEMKYIFPVIVCFVVAVWFAAKIPVSKWVQRLGDLTYPFYLLHDYLGLILISLIVSVLKPVGSIVFVMTLMLLIAYAVNTYVEHPLQQMMKNYLKRKDLLRSAQ